MEQDDSDKFRARPGRVRPRGTRQSGLAALPCGGAATRPELAPRLERGHPVLCLSGRRPPHPLHDERDRGAERQAASR